MKRHFYLLITAVLVGVGLGACKSKQKVVTIPNAHAQAGNSGAEAYSVASTNAVSPRSQSSTGRPMSEHRPASPASGAATSPQNFADMEPPEEVRDETFRLDAEEKDTGVMGMKFHVVVGSFKNRDNAKRLQQSLNEAGNNATIVLNEHGMYRVLMASFLEYKDARSKIDEIKGRFPDAWVLIQKEDAAR